MKHNKQAKMAEYLTWLLPACFSGQKQRSSELLPPDWCRQPPRSDHSP